MSRFVLVHGAWHGGWCWERVAARLRDAGHEVATPTLTGMAERASELTPEVGLPEHVEDVEQALGAGRQPAVLVGHSYAGVVVREAADRLPERVSRLVLVEAWLPQAGQSLLSIAPDWFAQGIRQTADEQGEGWRIPPPGAAAVGVSDQADAAWIESQLTDQPLRSFTDATRLNGAASDIPARAIVSAAGAPIPFQDWAERIGAPVRTIDGGHDLMVTSPEALARELAAAR